MKKQCQRYFDKITPDKEQKNKIYDRIIDKYDQQNTVKVETKKVIHIRSVLSAAAITAGLGAAAFLIVTHFPTDFTPEINTTSETEHEKISYDENDLTTDKYNSDSVNIQNVFSNDEKLVVEYSFDAAIAQGEQTDMIIADISTYINSESEHITGKISLIRSGNEFNGEMIYDVPENSTADTYKIRSEFSQIQTDSHKFLKDRSEVSCIKLVSDCEGVYNRYEIKPLGNINNRSHKKSIDAIAEITPFETTISLPGYEDYNIEVTDQNGIILNNQYETIFEPLNTSTSLLGIVASKGSDIQYFFVPVRGYRSSQYSDKKNMITKNTVNALSVLDEYNGIYNFDNNKRYTELSDYFTAHPDDLVEIGTQIYADSMFSSVSQTDLSDKLSVEISSSEFMNAANQGNEYKNNKLSDIIDSLRGNDKSKRFAVLSVTYNVHNKSDEAADFYFYGGHPVMKSFTESFEDPDFISNHTVFIPQDSSYPDKQFTLAAGEDQKIVLGYIVPAETLSLGFYISASNNGNFVLMDTK